MPEDGTPVPGFRPPRGGGYGCGAAIAPVPSSGGYGCGAAIAGPVGLSATVGALWTQPHVAFSSERVVAGAPGRRGEGSEGLVLAAPGCVISASKLRTVAEVGASRDAT